MTASQSAFQDAFARALFSTGASSPGDAAGLGALTQQPAFAVYRNTVMKGCIDALQANHPAVCRLVGETWFRAAAAVHVLQSPPRDTRLHTYGDGFADFLACFVPAAELPYLPGVARLDRFWTEAHLARDEAVLHPAAITALTPERLMKAVARPHPAARWVWFHDMPVYTIWRRQREAIDTDTMPEWNGEGALLTRPEDAVRWTALNAAGCAFLDACAAGLPLEQATQHAMKANPNTDLSALIATLLDQGALTAVYCPKETP